MNHSTTQSTDRHGASGGMLAGSALLSAGSISGDEVHNMQDENLGNIKEIMIDVAEGKVRYAVLSSGGFLGLGDRLFAIPWKALKLDKDNKCFMLDIDAERLKNAPGFSKDEWPNMADPNWSASVESYYTR